MYSGGFLPPSGPFMGFPPGADYFPDINSCGRSPQAYTNAVVNRGGPLGPISPGAGMIPFPPTAAPYLGISGAGSPPPAPPMMMPPPDAFRHGGMGESEQEGVPSWLGNPVFRWGLYALAAVAIWKLGFNLILKDLFRR